MPRLFLILFLISSLIPSPRAQGPLASGAELLALYSLRSSLGLRARDWPRKSDPCSAWSGVGCRAGRVASLNLSGLRRTRLGRRNPRFAVDGLRNLSRISSFNATGFALTGHIPNWLGTALPNSFSVLALSGCSIFGPIPRSLSDLSALAVLDISSNSLTGALPEGLKNLTSLQVLDLSGNSLTGILSNTIFSRLLSVTSIALAGNNFSGTLPDTLFSLPALRFVDVSRNSLTGQLPDSLPANESGNMNASGSVFNLSNNLYYGSVPAGFGVILARFGMVDLSGNYFQGVVPVGSGHGDLSFRSNCFRNLSSQRSPADCLRFYTERGLPYDDPAASSSHRKRRWSLKYILIAVFAGIAVLLLLILVIVLCLMRRRTQSEQATGERESSSNVAPSGARAQPSSVSVNLSAVGDSFTYEQLLQATSDFNESNLIKHGHSGYLYRGVLEDGIPVVVKRIDVKVVKRESYVAELDFFAKASHVRLVPFLGHCLENENEKALVYKYLPHGDLSNALFREPGQEEEGLQSLDWITRLKIATGVAEALCFLHHECMPPLVHRDVQASSILLDDKFEVRLGSLSEVCAQEGDGQHNVITRFLRLSSQTPDQKAAGSPSATCAYDVYCLGKVLLELVTGKLGISGSNDGSTAEWLGHTLPYINIYEKELVTKIVDPSLIVDEDLLEEVWAMAIVAKSCLNPKPSKRPLVKYILKALENPLKVVREENNSGSIASSRRSWSAAVFGSWRNSSSDNIASLAGPSREDRTLRHSGTMRSHGSGGEHSFSRKKPSKEIFPEPSGADDIDDL